MKHNKIIITIHWVIALLFVLLFLSDSFRSFSDKSSEMRVLWLNLHAWFGVAVFGLSMIRLAVKLSTTAPAPVYESDLMRKLLYGAHTALYLLTLLVPISGYLRFAGKGRALTLAGDAIPSLIDKSDWLYNIGKTLHGEVMQVIVLTVIGGHIAAALYHHFIVKDQVMSRIKP
ncbi:cytochrome b [Vibrio anguillarum]|uniref:cytochrome b n=1 Tax=Vibrio anguillarum TaxID=55601 RepID=UPI002FE459F2